MGLMWFKNYLFHRPTYSAAMYQAPSKTQCPPPPFFYVSGNAIHNPFVSLDLEFLSCTKFLISVLFSPVTCHILCSALLSFSIVPLSACQELCIDWKIARDKPFSITVSFSPEPAKQQFKGSQTWSISSTMGRLRNVLYLYRPTLSFFPV